MYCPSCGKNVPEGAKFCESCGVAQNAGGAPAYQAPPQYNAPPPQYGPQPYGQPPGYLLPMKNAGIAAVLALIIPGAGHIYLGKIGEGIIYLVLAIILGVLFWLIVPLIILLVLYIWQIYDAYNKANEYNAALQQTGRAPW